jgi:hypothetical protein
MQPWHVSGSLSLANFLLEHNVRSQKGYQNFSAHHCPSLIPLSFISLCFLSRFSMQQRLPHRSAFFMTPPAREPYSGPPCGSVKRQLSEDEKDALFADPMSIVGKQFVAQPDGLAEIPYKVVSLNISEDGLLYQVTFVDCVDSVEYSRKDMMAMVKDSVLLE